MTKRAIFIGLIIASLVGVIGFFNDMVMRQTFLFNNYIPIFVYGLLFLFVVSLNPLLRAIGTSFVFSNKELALILAIVLPASWLGSRTLIHHFTNVVMMPRIHNLRQQDWQKRKFLRRTPSVMLAGVQAHYTTDDIPDPNAVITQLGALNTETPHGKRLSRALAKIAGPSPDHVLVTLNTLLMQEGLFMPEDIENLSLPQHAREILTTGTLNSEELERLNRYCLDTVLGNSVVSLESKEDLAINKFQLGMQEGSEHISFGDIPWYAWTRTLGRFWFPLILALCFTYVGLSLIVKRQWTKHEHISFPIVGFAQSLLPEKDGRMSQIFTKRMFWIVVAIVTIIHLNNYASRWWPDRMVPFPTFFDFSSLSNIFPILSKGGGGMLLRPTIYFTVVGFAYFVASDVSGSIGLAPFIYAIVAGTLLTQYNINLESGGDYNSLRLNNFIKSGSYFGMFLIILYTGRHYYMSVLRKMAFLKPKDEVLKHEAWGARLAVVGALVFAYQLTTVGVQWHWAIFHVCVVCISFIVVSRMVGETGMFMIHPMIMPVVILWAFVGPRALGPQQMLVLFFISAALDFGCHVGVMPMMLHGLKLTDSKPGKTAGLAAAGITLALIVGVMGALYFQYDIGAASSSTDGWANRLSVAPYKPMVDIENRLEAQGVLDDTGKLFSHWAPAKGPVIAFVITMFLVLLTEFCRLKIPKWPIHPVMFLITGFWHAKVLAVSFLVGWLLKRVIMKYGGTSTYRNLKPAMIGLIAGDMLAGVLIMLFCFLYYMVTGEQPKNYNVFPG